MKKLACLICVLLLILPQSVLADTPRSGNLTQTVSWSLSENGVLTISGTGEMPDYPFLSSDGEDASPPWAPFAGEITEIYVSEGITRIGAHSFFCYLSFTEPAEYVSVQKITFPSTLQSVGSDAFFTCSSGSDIRPTLHIPSLKDWCEIEFETDGVYSDSPMGQFSSPVGLTGVPYIDGKQPSGTIVFPKSLTEVKSCAFSNWTGITEIVLHDGITEIGELAFSAPDLQKINLPDGIPDIKMGTFCGCYDLTEIDIPDSVESIGFGAFYACFGLTEVTLPTSLHYLGTDVFALCEKLSTIHITDLASYLRIFSEVPHQDGYLLQGNRYGKRTLYLNGEKLSEIVIPSEIKVIPPYAFYGCDTLTKVTFEDTVDLIGVGAFADCTALTAVQRIIGGGTIRTAGAYIVQGGAFSGCTSLTDVPSVYDYIGKQAFANCTALTEIELDTTQLAPDAFKGCTSLTSAKLPIALLDCTVDKTHSLYALTEVKLWGTETTDAFLEHFTESGKEGNRTVYTRCDHDWVQKDGSPRATKDGCAFDSECTKCKKVKTDLQSHEIGDWAVVVEPTESNNGKEELACTVCGEVLNQKTLEKLPPSEESTEESEREPAEISEEPSAPTESAASEPAPAEPDKEGVPVWATVLTALLAASCGAGIVWLWKKKK